MMRRARRASTCAGVFATLIVAATCSAPTRSADTVVYASGTDLESANPLATVHPLSRQIQRFVLLVTLARYDTALVPRPYAARSWEWSRDHRVLTLHLVPSIRWHDGQSTTSRDVAFTTLAGRDPATGYARAADLAAIDTVLTPDDSTAVIDFRDRQTAFPSILCELPILPAHILGSVKRSDLRRAAY